MQANSATPAASPSARRLADENGLDLRTIEGTGPAGKITKDDVANASMKLGESVRASSTSAPAKAEQVVREVLASPLARRLAAEKGVDLSIIKGSGPNGRIVRSDVEDFEPAAQGDQPSKCSSPVVSEGAALIDSAIDAPFEEQKLSNVRKVIARRLTEAKQTVPHYYLTADIRLDALLDLRKQLNASLATDGVKLSVNDFLIKALARALQRVPTCNVSYRDDKLLQFQREDISVAVAGPSGLITPVVRGAGEKGVVAISSEMKALAGKAREGKLQPHEYQGGTASLSNLGMFGIKQFSAVINPPHGMILAIGAGEQRPIVVDNALTVANVMNVTGSFDHRAIDGALGAELIQAFRDIIEQPYCLLG
ncbi:MAG: 2-oxo acid dehydrogenase subunit E2 [Pseudomonadota bacterium]